MQLYLLRYGELGIKSPSTRRNFEDILIDNLERSFLKAKAEIFIERERGRLFAYAHEDSSYMFSRTFGLVSYSPAAETGSSLKDMEDVSKGWARGLEGSFAVRARRVGDHPYSSPKAAAQVGAYVLEENPNLDVDLDEPDHTLYLEIRGKRAYVFSKIKDGPGGLPLSSQGKVAAWVDSNEGFLAAWLMMKRGARAYIYYPPDSVYHQGLDRWDPNLRSFEHGSLEEALSSHQPKGIKGWVLGDTVDELRDVKHHLPIYRPLIGFTWSMIEDELMRIKKLESRR
ncbi:MAG: THUMP domain-containing protein [Thermoplasmata archaeon]